MNKKVFQRKAEKATGTEALTLGDPAPSSCLLGFKFLGQYKVSKGDINMADSLRLTSSTIYMYLY
jgi:hypothetical protein